VSDLAIRVSDEFGDLGTCGGVRFDPVTNTVSVQVASSFGVAPLEFGVGTGLLFGSEFDHMGCGYDGRPLPSMNFVPPPLDRDADGAGGPGSCGGATD